MFFTSFTGTIGALLTGRVWWQDLQDGLFVFGCCRSQCVNPVRDIPSVVQSNPLPHRLIVEAVLAAEQDNRARWIDPGDPYSWERRINELLLAHGYPAMLPWPPKQYQPLFVQSALLTLMSGAVYFSPSHDDVERAIAGAGLPLQVIWRGRRDVA
jgi:hypothetical protein